MELLCGVLVLLTALRVNSQEQNSFTNSTQRTKPCHLIENIIVTGVSPANKGPVKRTFIQDLYQVLSKGQKPMPFGAECVRSFQGTGNIFTKYIEMDFNMRMPEDDKIVHAMLHFCAQHRIPSTVASLKVTDVVTGISIAKRIPEVKSDRCFKIPVTGMLKARRRQNQTAIPMTIQVSMRGKSNSAKHISRLYWNAERSVLKEVIIFSKEANAKSRLADFQLNKKHKAIKRRSLVEDKARKPKEKCSRSSLMVTFSSIGYSNVIAPPSFDAGQCIGECKYPLGDEFNPTQHAVLQQLMRSQYGSKIAKSPCCAPRRLIPLTVIFRDKLSDGVALRSFKDVVVSKCGCL